MASFQAEVEAEAEVGAEAVVEVEEDMVLKLQEVTPVVATTIKATIVGVRVVGVTLLIAAATSQEAKVDTSLSRHHTQAIKVLVEVVGTAVVISHQALVLISLRVIKLQVTNHQTAAVISHRIEVVTNHQIKVVISHLMQVAINPPVVESIILLAGVLTEATATEATAKTTIQGIINGCKYFVRTLH